MFRSRTKEKLTLIDCKYFECLSFENGEYIYKDLDIKGLSFIPVLLSAHTIKSGDQLIYEISYFLPYSHEFITPKYNDFFITLNGSTKQIKKINEDYECGLAPIRLNNENISLAKKISNSDTIPLEYVFKKRKQLSALNKLLDESSSLAFSKKKKIVK